MRKLNGSINWGWVGMTVTHALCIATLCGLITWVVM